MRKWAGNSSALLVDIDAANHSLACNKSLAPDERVKILGIAWNPSNDIFQFQVSLAADVPEGKRAILSAIAKLFDPLGWVTPVTISAKIFIQQLWRHKLDWDETIRKPLLSKWKLIYSKFSHLNGLQVDRWTGLGFNTHQAEFNGFSDASNSVRCGRLSQGHFRIWQGYGYIAYNGPRTLDGMSDIQ